jgi:hypothetical protein
MTLHESAERNDVNKIDTRDDVTIAFYSECNMINICYYDSDVILIAVSRRVENDRKAGSHQIRCESSSVIRHFSRCQRISQTIMSDVTLSDSVTLQNR